MSEPFIPQPAAGERWIVGAVIRDGAGRIFMQRRSASRSLFPGAWDLVGGHLEPGESILDCLARELREETDWELQRVVAALEPLSWTGNDGLERREIDYIVEVSGDLSHPRLEEGLHLDPRWVTLEEARRLLDGTHQSDGMVLRVVEQAFHALA